MILKGMPITNSHILKLKISRNEEFHLVTGLGY